MYYNGFALQGESHFFDAFLAEGPYARSGFSYGAIKAFKETLKSEKRIDTLQLISPAFFQSKSEKFKRLQRMGYQKSSDAYIANFTKNCFLPHGVQDVLFSQHCYEELDELLSYEWKHDELRSVAARGTKIEVYLGSEDRITDVEAAYAFFVPFATVYLIKGANHFLQGEEYE
ncbi:pimelyl-ACP methyl ester esterase BioV [Sulfurimonas sp. HSL3-7]|uniref:pimelyl-ACP methyl ester esterase BioV n=1 Tax=Sulfonitrofixus jiaomeiensis TaxID=3131938 RepID=UPI0031F7C7FB